LKGIGASRSLAQFRRAAAPDRSWRRMERLERGDSPPLESFDFSGVAKDRAFV
jgi:hypothetical protein